jgi:WD40 repeat protein/serine/threonine protein kinase
MIVARQRGKSRDPRMRTCPACQHELDQGAIVQGKCPRCGAILRKLSQRTIDSKRVPGATDSDSLDDQVDEFNLDEFVKPEQHDTDPGSHTIEISEAQQVTELTFDDDKPAVDLDDVTPLEEGGSLADLAADVQARDEADEFILGGDSVDLKLLDDDVEIGHSIEISEVALDRDKMGHNIEDMTPLEDENRPLDLADLPEGDAAIDYISDHSLDRDLADIVPLSPTIEISEAHLHDDDEPPVEDDDATPLEEVATDDDRKSPTIDYTSDMTMEFQSLSEASGLGAPPHSDKATGRSTHSLDSEKTVDLSMSPAEANLMDSQWRGTFDLGTKQGQTIRQRETITGYRSSLPVKSRYVREKRKGPATAPKSLSEVPDYELLDIIGEGGMGVVYAAHQSSIARTVAVKMLKPSAKVREEQRDKFISEAVVTGELDHPNIVPIYDLGSNDEGALFYSMKRVRGTPWDKVIHQKSLDDNVGILMRVADAVAFAHAGGVIHRDLKPENVMLGDYGEVLVMDWGLARITSEFAHVDAVYQADSLGGTPAYMSPEMAKGPVDSINKTSDIYLLGAILYEIIGGQPPHSGRDVMQCLMAASQNRIDPIRYDGELKAIALKAMATQQEDRYQTVKELQEAIHVYQSHSESLVLTAHANQNLQKARSSKDYQLFARALYGFQESLALWDQNHRARLLLGETQRDYATAALDKGDLDLGASLLDKNHAEHQPLIAKIEKARKERDARQRRLRLAKFAVAALIATVIVTISLASVFFRAERNKAVVAQKDAETQRGIAVQQKGIAEEQRTEAVQQKKVADEQRGIAVEQRGIAEEKKNEADKQRARAVTEQKRAEEQTEIAVGERQKAEKAKQNEEYEAYIAQIGLANARINDSAYDYALTLLDATKPELRNWEWGRLVHLCRLGAGNYKAGAPVVSVAYSPDGKSFVTGDQDGKVTVRDAKTGDIRFQVPHGQYVLSVDYSPNGKMLASGSSDKTIQILDATTGKVIGPPLQGHTDGVLSVRFSPDSKQLLSGSYDNTARLWDVATATTLQQFRGHSWWVWAGDFSPNADRIVTAGQDGRAVVWEKWTAMQQRLIALGKKEEATKAKPTSESLLYGQLTSFTEHNGAVYSARFSPNGKFVVTGGYDKLVMIWNPDEVKPTDVGSRLEHKPDVSSKYIRLAGHDGPVRSVSFSPKGQLVLSSSEDNTIRVWDATSGKTITALRGHGRAVRTCAFSPDGEWVLSGSDDERVRVWNVQGYRETRVLHATVFSGHEDAVLSARYSRDGKEIVTASRDRTASLWDAATGKPIKRFEEGHEFLVSSAVFLPDKNHLATGAGDNSVRIWDMTAGTQQAVLSPTGRIGTLAVSPDGQWIATGSTGTDVKLWNPSTGEPRGDLSGHESEVSALMFSPTGDRLVSGDGRGHLRVWRKSSDAWEFERELSGHSGAITAIRFTPDGKRLVTASADHSCAQWDLATAAEDRPLVLKHSDYVSSLDMSPDGTRVLTSCDDGSVRLWRLADAKQLASVKSPGRPFTSVGFSPDGSTAILTSPEDKRVSLWDLSVQAAVANPQAEGASSLRPLLDFNQLGGEVWASMFVPDGRHVLTLGGNDAQLWDLESRKAVIHYSPHGAVASAAVSADGKLIATGSWDHSAKIWDAKTGHAIRKLEGGHTGYVNSVEFSSDGRELLTASDDGFARIWDIASGKPTGIAFDGNKARMFAATYSPDGKTVLTASADKTAQVWDRATGKPAMPPLKGHEWAVLCGQFSADGKRIITGSQDASARIWDAKTGRELMKLAGHTAAVTSVAFSPDGTRALTGSRDNTAKLWDATTGKEILSLPGHTQEVTSVSFSPDGRNVLTSSRDGTAIIWLARDWHQDNAKVANVIDKQ